jgi:hypothetical protein
MGRRHDHEQAFLLVGHVCFHHGGAATTVHGMGFGPDRATMGVAQQVRTELYG